MVKKEEKWDTLDGVLEGIWKMLGRGVSNYRDPFHWPVLGTTDPRGPNMRCVILRGFSKSDRVLVCHTDARAVKVQEISASSSVGWLFYHPQKKVQLRISGHATLHTDDEFADSQWAASRISSRLNYCATEPPGSPWPAACVPLRAATPVVQDARHHYLCKVRSLASAACPGVPRVTHRHSERMCSGPRAPAVGHGVCWRD